ncbi:hypothetical protein [Lacticaseibacillus saniviri]|uniref:hypothetical protein n=1 Tax=Lacticaseibacillus saniviri TaxID=931533 RepID=UPI001EDE9215|nr:hypothetical protein [Lacticaseibacillus saniviri]MCG4280894.1 hypothetical protein [Lacticaseibacillus saniviri]
MKIKLGEWQIESTEPREITVSKVTTDKAGKEALTNRRYFPTFAMAARYLRDKLALTSDTNTLDELVAAYDAANQQLDETLAKYAGSLEAEENDE